MIDGKLLRPATVTKDKLNLTDPTSALEPATKQWVEALIASTTQGRPWKDPVTVAVGSNVNISNPGTAVFDGVTLTSGVGKVLLYGQTTGSQNGGYLFNGSGSPMTRLPDMDSSAELLDGSLIPIQQGTHAGKYFQMTTDAAITLGTTSLTFSAFNPAGTAPVPTTADKNLAASTTTTDFDVACNTGLTATPANGGYVLVVIGSVIITIGDGVKTAEAYFSGNSGTTARALNAIQAGDKLYWVGSVAGYQLNSATDKVSYFYNV